MSAVQEAATATQVLLQALQMALERVPDDAIYDLQQQITNATLNKLGSDAGGAVALVEAVFALRQSRCRG